MRTVGMVVAGILLVVFAAGAGVAQAAGDAVKGKATFQQSCSTCHGATGKGDGAAGAALNPKPKDLSDKAFNVSLKQDYLVRIIKEGGQAMGKSPIMPKFGGTLKDDQIQDVIAFIRSLVSGK
jgi:mono/diheme cytochrome c family protein